jgi:predicted dienelactone hydrolase
MTSPKTLLRFLPHTAATTAVATLAVALMALPSVALAQVGRTELTLAGTAVSLVYPTQEAARPLQAGPFAVQVATDAAPLAGPLRVVVMSHGTGGSFWPDFHQAEAMAREGLVAVQVQRTGDNHRDARDAGPVAFERGPLEVKAVLDALAAHPAWGPRLQLDRVGAHGMSAGGAVTLSLAGARWRMLDLIRHCNEHDAADAGFCYQGAADPDKRQAREANFRHAKGVPEQFLPAPLRREHAARDERVVAVSLTVPVAAIFSAEALAQVRVPVGVVTATADQVLLPRFHAEHVLRHVPHGRRLASVPGGHFDVLSPWPASVAAAVAAQQVVGGEVTPGAGAAERQAAYAAVARFHKAQLAP